jgi:hypothetical protein
MRLSLLKITNSLNKTRHAELVSAPIKPLSPPLALLAKRCRLRPFLSAAREEKWALKQVQGDGVICEKSGFPPH